MLDIFSRKVIHAEAHPYERELLARDLTDLHVGPPTMCSVPETGPAQNPCYSADMGISQRKVASTTAGLPKVGGGSWYVYSSGSSATGRPFCENFG